MELKKITVKFSLFDFLLIFKFFHQFRSKINKQIIINLFPLFTFSIISLIIINHSPDQKLHKLTNRCIISNKMTIRLPSIHTNSITASVASYSMSICWWINSCFKISLFSIIFKSLIEIRNWQPVIYNLTCIFHWRFK